MKKTDLSPEAIAKLLQSEVEAFTDAGALLEWVELEPEDAMAADAYFYKRGRWRAVAEYARVFDRALLEAMSQEAETLVRALMENQVLRESDAYGRLALDVCLDILEVGKANNARGHAISAMGHLAKLGHLPGQGPEMDRLWAIADRMDQGGWKGQSLRTAMLHAPDLSSDRVLALLALGQEALFRPCCEHPNANDAVWTEALRRRFSPPMLSCLAQIPEARRHPKIRLALRAYGMNCDGEVLCHLMSDHVPGEFAPLFRELWETAPGEVARALLSATEEERATLSQEDLLPLLKAQNQTQRLAAISAFGQTQPMELVVECVTPPLTATPITREEALRPQV